MFDHTPKPVAATSVLKLLSDLYSTDVTAGVLYTNDALVLIDIITGQITASKNIHRCVERAGCEVYQVAGAGLLELLHLWLGGAAGEGVGKGRIE